MADQRASDADRDQAVEQLRRAAGEGRLTIDELDERLERAHGALTRATLTELLEDVADGPGGLTPAAAGAGGSALTVRQGPGGSSWVVSIMSGATRAGRWRVASRCTVLNVMGGSDIDLNEAELADDVVEMTVFSLMGGADIYVPEELRVEVSDIGIMGGNDVQRGNASSEDRSGPLLRLRLISIMGGANVRRGRKRSKAERREQRNGREMPSPPPRLPHP